MTVSKRVRYEVLRRDDFTCRYCHSKDKPLQVDHVIPIALGGKDTPDNLVAACRDCNVGKSSVQPDEKSVSDVSEEQLSLAKALKQMLGRKSASIEEQSRFDREFIDYWYQSAEQQGDKYAHPDDNWRSSLAKWHDIGIPQELVFHAVDLAFDKKAISQSSKYRYMCGVVWSMLGEVEADVVHEHGSSTPRRCGHCVGCLNPSEYGDYCALYHTDEDEDPMICNICRDPDCKYELGVAFGEEKGFSDAADFFAEHPERLPKLGVDHD